NILRLILMAVLIVMLMTDPPRDHRIRAVFGAAAVFFTGWTGMQMLWYSTYLLDMMVFLQAAVICALEAIELSPDDEDIYEEAAEPARVFRSSVTVEVNEPVAPVIAKQTFEAVPQLARRLLTDTGRLYRQDPHL